MTLFMNQGQAALSSDLSENLQQLQTVYENCSDVIFRPFLIAGHRKAVLIYIEGLSNVEEIDQNVLAPLMWEAGDGLDHLNHVVDQQLSVSKVHKVCTISEVIEQISNGSPVILIEGENQGISLGLAKWDKRAIAEPDAERSLRGPRDGFTETLGVNMALLRRRIKSPDLKMQSMKIGRYTQTQVVLSYIDGIADDTLISEAKKRLQRIDIDGVLDSGMIEELIIDYPFSPFPQILATERPDVAAAGLLEGRVLILMDSTPFCLLAPTTFYSMVQAADDYYQSFLIGTTTRWLRFAFVIIAMLLPSIYVAILTFHQEMVPTTLLLSIAGSREMVPFPALVEALAMEFVFEGLREAGVRLPKQIGSAVSIVGALVIGEAAVSAGLISAPMVIVVALTGIASFTLPRYSIGIPIRLLRFPLVILAGILGMLGIMLGTIGIIVHLCTLRSFGVPYLTPMAPMQPRDMKDVLLRAPLWMQNTRPHFTGRINKFRQSLNQKPDPAKGDES